MPGLTGRTIGALGAMAVAMAATQEAGAQEIETAEAALGAAFASVPMPEAGPPPDLSLVMAAAKREGAPVPCLAEIAYLAFQVALCAAPGLGFLKLLLKIKKLKKRIETLIKLNAKPSKIAKLEDRLDVMEAFKVGLGAFGAVMCFSVATAIRGLIHCLL